MFVSQISSVFGPIATIYVCFFFLAHKSLWMYVQQKIWLFFFPRPRHFHVHKKWNKTKVKTWRKSWKVASLREKKTMKTAGKLTDWQADGLANWQTSPSKINKKYICTYVCTCKKVHGGQTGLKKGKKRTKEKHERAKCAAHFSQYFALCAIAPLFWRSSDQGNLYRN